MKAVIIMVLIVWFLSALARSKQQQRIERVEEEQKRTKQVQVAQAKEQARQAKEQKQLSAKIEKERQDRIDAEIKLEKRIATLEMKVEQADLDIEIEEENLDRYAAKLRRLDEDLKHADFEIEAWTKQRHPANAAKAEEKKDKIQDSIYIWEDKVRKAEKRLAKAQRTKKMLENELKEVA